VERPGAERSVQILDRALDIHQLWELADAIIQQGRWPDSFVEECKEYALVLAQGGCECTACAGLEADLSADCIYAATDLQIQRAVFRCNGMELGDTLDSPPWVAQVVRAIKLARAEARDGGKDEETKKQEKQIWDKYPEIPEM